ncbi:MULTISPECIES: methyltransferase [unclassified Caballeronia]|uniref:methyltransferase n=1 Tax=unclassified Caballeronia TaxID=2646786 RepID=UPI002856D503|nr:MULTISPECIES: methyltransferase [unclassified Caballeronia]MDR5736742.1 methyltransferase domain-containing protein [Caballeronia sp. LZ016]MDR5810777.1 methyltransferase domain-containing protein [Caballeronia sp. LZ019]
MSDPAFNNRNPDTPGFWDERFDQRFTPWDQAGVPEAFASFAAGLPDAAATRVLIPGCGSAYEASFLAEHGCTVRAIDFSASAVAAAREQLGARAEIVEQVDFFSYQPPFAPDWIYERAFLCALPKHRWTDYAARMAALLQPGALLAGFFFIGATPKGPPFGIERGELDALLVPDFELIDDREVSGSIPVFAGRERWLTWRRA